MKSLKDFGPILGVAVEYDNTVYRLPAPNRHHNVLHALTKKLGNTPLKKEAEEGFYSVTQTFMTREFAMEVAVACGQLKRDTTDHMKYQGPELFSEDLW